MIRRDGERLMLEGPVTFDTVPDLVRAAEPELRDGSLTIDFAGVTEVDSSAVALVLEWRRQAEHRNLALHVANLPPSIVNLAELYGVSELLQPVAI